MKEGILIMEYICPSTENKRILIATDLHYCDKIWHDRTKYERMKLLCEVINAEYEKQPFDLMLCLGDYSLDFWAWETKGTYLNTPSVSDTANFMKEVYPKFPVKPYMIPGNHEQYGNEKWKEITGFDRQYSIVYGDYVFLMCDTFAGNLDPTEHSDGTYTGIDTEFLKSALERHPDKKIILCAHDILTDMENEELKQLIRENERILCAFAGHTHRSNTLILDEEWRNLPIFYCGDFSYSNNSDKPGCNSGFRILDFSKGFSTIYIHV